MREPARPLASCGKRPYRCICPRTRLPSSRTSAGWDGWICSLVGQAAGWCITAASGDAASGDQLRELLRQLRPDPRLLVLEEDERVLPALPQLLHLLGPLLQVFLLVALVAQPQVAEVGRAHDGRVAVFRVRHAQRRVRGSQRAVYVVREPRCVAEFPCTPEIGGELGEQVVQAVEIFLEIGRQLEQDGPELRPELLTGLEEEAQRVVH